jgi:Fe-S-cluster containining protein
MEECGARCCRYITVILPPPQRECELDEWSWFLAHENVSIYFAGRRWRMEMRSRCRYLSDQNACTIYDRRPDVCRLYSQEDCEYAGKTNHLHHFDTKEEFDRWWEEKRERERRRRSKRSRSPRARRATASKGK